VAGAQSMSQPCVLVAGEANSILGCISSGLATRVDTALGICQGTFGILCLVLVPQYKKDVSKPS